MTVPELKQLYYLNGEITTLERELEKIDSWLETAPEQFIVPLTELRDVIAGRYQKCARERAYLENFIARISDRRLREIFTLRFAAGLSWQQVAMALSGCGDGGAEKKSCYRYLRQYEQRQTASDPDEAHMDG